MTDQEDRAKIEASIPSGWEDRHIRLAYDVRDYIAVMSTWGWCGHALTCLEMRPPGSGHWLHPYPHSRICDDPPTMRHIGIFGTGRPA